MDSTGVLTSDPTLCVGKALKRRAGLFPRAVWDILLEEKHC